MTQNARVCLRCYDNQTAIGESYCSIYCHDMAAADERIARLKAAWQEEHTERIRLEERLKLSSAISRKEEQRHR